MTLDQLAAFVAVAERRHFTRAADAIGRSQPAISAAIAALEAEYELKLFHRVGRSVELTEAGTLLLDEARAILSQVRLTESRLLDLNGLRHGDIAVGASQTIGNYWLPARLARFATDHPGISTGLSIGNTEEIAEAVSSGRIDLGLIEGPVEGANLALETFGADHLVLVVGRDHPWFARSDVSWPDLGESRWVMRESGSGTRAMFQSALTEQGMDLADLPLLAELPSGEALRAAVAAAPVAAMLSSLVVEDALAHGQLACPSPIRIRRDFTLLLDGRRYRSAAIEAFIRELKKN